MYDIERGVVPGRKKQGGAPATGQPGPAPLPAVPPAAAPGPAPTAAPGPAPAPGPASGPVLAKHKCARKQRVAPPHSDHHLPPPPDILDDHVSAQCTLHDANKTSFS